MEARSFPPTNALGLIQPLLQMNRAAQIAMAKLFVQQMGYVPGAEGEVATRPSPLVTQAAQDLVSMDNNLKAHARIKLTIPIQVAEVKKENESYQGQFWVSWVRRTAREAHLLLTRDTFTDGGRLSSASLHGGDVDLVQTRVEEKGSSLVASTRSSLPGDLPPSGHGDGQVCPKASA